MKEIFKLIIVPLILLLFLIVSKLILNKYGLEFRSWFYYLILLLMIIYGLFIINYKIWKSNKSKRNKIISYIFINIDTIFIVIIVILGLSLFFDIGIDKKMKNYSNLIVHYNTTGFHPHPQYYNYYNFLIRGTEEQICIDECY